MYLYGLLINAGQLTWGGSIDSFVFNSSGTLNNLASGTITLTNDFSTFGSGGTSGYAGLLLKAGTSGTTTLSAALVNSGAVQAQSGVLSFSSGGSGSGNFSAAGGATVDLSGGTFNLGTGTSISGAGNFEVDAATVNLGGTYAVTNGLVTITGGVLNFNGTGLAAGTNLNLSGGTLGGSNLVSVSAATTWSGGTINNTGGVRLNGASSLSAVNNNMYLYGLLINAGQLTWGGSIDSFVFNSSGTLNNLASGTITITNDFSTFGSGGTIGNAGLLLKAGTSGTTTLSAALVNSGAVDALSGVLR